MSAQSNRYCWKWQQREIIKKGYVGASHLEKEYENKNINYNRVIWFHLKTYFNLVEKGEVLLLMGNWEARTQEQNEKFHMRHHWIIPRIRL